MSGINVPSTLFNQIYSWAGECTDVELTKQTAKKAVAFLRGSTSPEEWGKRLDAIMDEVRIASSAYNEDYTQILLREIAKQQRVSLFPVQCSFPGIIPEGRTSITCSCGNKISKTITHPRHYVFICEDCQINYVIKQEANTWVLETIPFTQGE